MNYLKSLAFIAAIGGLFATTGAKAEDLSMLHDRVTITLSGYTGTETLENFPVLVRVSEEKIKGFLYSRAGRRGSDIRFADKDGNILPSEIDTWNEDGESLIWVKVPSVVANGVDDPTSFTMCWGREEGESEPASARPTEVWSDYLGVWHHPTADGAAAKDSTAYGRTATLGEPEAFATDADAVKARYLKVPGSVMHELQNTLSFTFTGSYKAALGAPRPEGDTWKTNPLLFGTWLADRNENGQIDNNRHVNQNGFGAGYWGASQIIFRTGSDDGSDPWFGNNPSGGYAAEHRFSFTVDGADGAIRATSDTTKLNSSAHACYKIGLGDLRVANSNYELREVRLSKTARSLGWVNAEYETLNKVDFADAMRDHKVVGANYWTREPSISPLACPIGRKLNIDVGDYALSNGDTGSIEVSYYAVSVEGKEEGSEVKSSELMNADGITKLLGSFRAVIRFRSMTPSLSLEKTIFFSVVEANTYSKLSPDRVMLFNSDAAENAKVENQGYYDTYNGHAAWRHEGDDWSRASAYPNMANGNVHFYDLGEPGAEGTSWELRYARVGNLFSSTGVVAARVNALPVGSESARDFENSAIGVSENKSGAAAVYLQNVTGKTEDAAMIVSPIYETGFGAIYFDAVNAFRVFKNRVRVDIATEWDEIGPVWKPAHEIEGVKVEFEKIVNGAVEGKTQSSANSEIKLDIATGGGSDSFYRVKVSANLAKRAQFRIVRADSNWSSGGLDGDGLIAIDNIIVPECESGVKLEQFGGGKDNVNSKVMHGWKAPFDVAFPAAGQENVHPRVKVAYTGITGEDIKGSMLVFMYRSRYLNQRRGEWKSLNMVKEAEKVGDMDVYSTTQPIDLSDGASDIEYYYQMSINPHTYTYFDYSGLDVGDTFGGESAAIDRNRVVYNAASEGLFLEDSETSPAQGRDFFVRLREGESDYEQMTIVAKLGERLERVPMRLVANHTWQGVVAVTNQNVDVGLRLLAHNHQINGSRGAYSTNETDFKIVSNSEDPTLIDKLSFSGSVASLNLEELEETGGFVKIKRDLVETARQLIVRFNDSAMTASVSRGDYQDFNTFASAATGLGKFVGTVTDSVETSIAQHRYAANYQDNTIDNWSLSVLTTNYWQNGFNLANISDVRKNEYYEDHKLTSGWVGHNVMLVNESYKRTGANDAALKLFGFYGSADFRVNTVAPDGIGEMSFTGRVSSQVNDLSKVAYYTPGMKESNYLFSTRVAMSVGDALQYDGEASVSLFAYYRGPENNYELRITRTGETSLNFKFIRRYIDDNLIPHEDVMRSVDRTISVNRSAATDAGSANNVANTYLTSLTKESAYIAFFGVKEMIDSTGHKYNQLVGGFTNNNGAGGNRVSLDASETQQRNYIWVAAKDEKRDSDGEPYLYRGTVGVLASDCPAAFIHPKLHEPFAITFGNDQANSDKLTIPEVREDLSKTQRQLRDDWERGGFVAAQGWGRRNGLDEIDSPYYGFEMPSPRQTITVYTGPVEDTDNNWTQCGEPFEVTGFKNSEHAFNVYSKDPCFVKIKVGGTPADKGYDVIVDDISFTQWHGRTLGKEESGKFDIDVTNPLATYATDGIFAYTCAWIEELENHKHAATLQPLRAKGGELLQIRSPRMLDGAGYGRGLSAIAFSYDLATLDENVKLIVEVNKDFKVVETATMSKDGWYQPEGVKCTFEYDDLKNASGSILVPFSGLRGEDVLVRLRLDDSLIAEAETNKAVNPNYGRISITGVAVWDDPVEDSANWTAMNVRAVGDASDSDGLTYLYDSRIDAAGRGGWSLELNNSLMKDRVSLDEASMDNALKRLPYVQSPSLISSEDEKVHVGEISFMARLNTETFTGSAENAKATVWVYGMTEDEIAAGTLPEEPITKIVIDSTRWKSYKYTSAGDYSAIRLVMGELGSIDSETSRDYTASVVLDEVYITERVDPRLRFAYVRPFRNHIDDGDVVPNVSSAEEQPLLGEAWGVQCEIQIEQLEEEIDLDRAEPFDVTIKYFVADSETEVTKNWGYPTWSKLTSKVREGKLTRARNSVGGWIYRSQRGEMNAFMTAINGTSSRTVPFSVEVVYYLKNDPADSKTEAERRKVMTLDSPDRGWTTPEWYYPIDMNEGKGANFSAYTILDSIAPHRAWINEVNITEYNPDTHEEVNIDESKLDQWVEIAVPAGVDMFGWTLEGVVPSANGSITLATFGFEAPAVKGRRGEGDRYAFVVLKTPLSDDARIDTGFKSDGELNIGASNQLSPAFVASSLGTKLGGRIETATPFALRLKRPSGVVEHEVLVVGDNYYADKDNTNKTPEDSLRLLKAMAGHASAYYVGCYDMGKPDGETYPALGYSVTLGKVASASDIMTVNPVNWANNRYRTPGRENELHQIAADYWIEPHTDSIWVYSFLRTGHLAQTLFGDEELQEIAEDITTYVSKNDSTTFFYRADPWYVIDSIRMNGVLLRDAPNKKEYEIVLDQPNNDVKIEVSARLSDAVNEAIPESQSEKYGEAVVKWLESLNLEGREDTINFATLVDMAGNDVLSTPSKPDNGKLNLVEMYWLDMDPSLPGWRFQIGMSSIAAPDAFGRQLDLVDQTYGDGETQETVFNPTTRVKLLKYREVDSAKVDVSPIRFLRGVKYGDVSSDANNEERFPRDSWSGPTFKITGSLTMNGSYDDNRYPELDGKPYQGTFLPIQVYHINEASLNEDGTADVEILDPFSLRSPVRLYPGWREVGPTRDERASAVWYSISIDDRKNTQGRPFLKTNTTYNP